MLQARQLSQAVKKIYIMKNTESTAYEKAKQDIDNTSENIELVAQKILDDMDFDDLKNYVYDDLVCIMGKDEELFYLNVESLRERGAI